MFRNSNISMAITALQNATGGAYNAGINFYWALRYVPAGQSANSPSMPANYNYPGTSAIGIVTGKQIGRAHV